MPYFQSLPAMSTPPKRLTLPVNPSASEPPGSGQKPVPSGPPAGLDPTKAYAFSDYEVGGVWVRPGPPRELNSRPPGNQDPEYTTHLHLLNIGDRAIQIGSHIHLADVNDELLFFNDDGAEELDRFLATKQELSAEERAEKARALALKSLESKEAPWGYRLDIAPGDSMRFSPEHSPSDRIEIVKIGGKRRVPGLRKDKPATDVDLDNEAPANPAGGK